MDFRHKIQSYMKKITGTGKKQWKKEVQSEKKKKYLFSVNTPDETFQSSRTSNSSWFKKEKILAFSNFIQEEIITRDIIKNHGYAMSIIGLMLIFMTTYIVIFSPYFKISPSQVIVEAMTPGIDIGIAYRALEWVYGESIFLFDEASTARKLKSNLKNLESVTIDRYYPNGIKVLIYGSPILYDTEIVGIPGKKWWLSKNGVLIPANDLGDSIIKYHLDITAVALIGDVFLNYKQGIDERSMQVITQICDVWSKEWTDLKIGKSRYFAGENELHLILEWGTKIILALQDDTDKVAESLPKSILDQLVTLRTYIANNQVSLTNGSINYIDARISGRLFVCRDPWVCNKNLITIYGDTYR